MAVNVNSNVESNPLMAAEILTSSHEDNEKDTTTKGNKTSRSLLLMRSIFKWRFPRMPSRRDLGAYITPGRRMNAWCNLLQTCVECGVYLLGPFLICLASAIIGLLGYTYFFIYMDMLWHYYATTNNVAYGRYMIGLQTAVVIYLMISVIWNYALCVITSNMKGTSYNQVMREMATATGFVFPETPLEVEQFRKDYEDRMVQRMQGRSRAAQQANNQKSNATTANKGEETVTQRKNVTQNTKNNNTAPNSAGNGPPTNTPPVRAWMVLGPLEWGFCNRTQQPKPPRSHYCHVSKGLVFCLDHYCPWMFTVGYFNYRYFVNFLIFACVSMLYAASLAFTPFMMTSTNAYHRQAKQEFKRHHQQWADNLPLDHVPRMQPFLPYPHEKMYITLTFMLSAAVGLAVMMLCAFHIYLTLTSQTTIEFHGNWVNSRKAKKLGKKWRNPYDFGAKRNFQQVYGSSYHPLLAVLLPSAREPEYLPIPLTGDQGKRGICKGADSHSRKKGGDFIV